MAISVSEFKTTIYVAGGYSGVGTNAPVLRVRESSKEIFNESSVDVHGALKEGNCVSFTVGAPGSHSQSGGRNVSFGEPNKGGQNAVFLPFFANHICSAHVPLDRASGVVNFFTANLSGCAIYIFEEEGTHDLIVCHANAMNKCYKQAEIEADPSKAANLPAQTAMRAMSGFAGAYWAGKKRKLYSVKAKLHRDVYLKCVDDEIARKQAMGRKNVQLLGAGTNVMGFRGTDGGWEFWFQTWARLEYDRPFGTLAYLKGKHVAQNTGTAKILGCNRFYPVA